MDNKEILLLKVAEHRLVSGRCVSAVERLIAGARKAGTSKYQVLILHEDLIALAETADAIRAIKWPELPETKTK